MEEYMIAEIATSFFDKLLNACVESKRIDAEIEAVKAKAEVAHHSLDVREKELELQHKEIMKEIDERTKILLKHLDSYSKEIEANCKIRNKYLQELKRITDQILNIKTPEETRDKLIVFYDKVSQKIENITMGNLQTSIAMIHNTDKLCLSNTKSSLQKLQ